MKYTKVNDSGKRRSFGTGSVRDVRDGKGRYDLIPPYPIERLAQHFENGAKKYGDNNWRLGQPLSSYLDSALRHVFKFQGGARDEDHLTAAVWNLIAFIDTERRITAGLLPAKLNDLYMETPDATGTGRPARTRRRKATRVRGSA